jgi:hypothetical protein
VFIETIDVSIDRYERIAPVLGVVPYLQYPFNDTSGSIIVFSDSACIDSASNTGSSKCFSFFERLVRLATSDLNK